MLRFSPVLVTAVATAALSFGPKLVCGQSTEAGIEQETTFIWPTSILNLSLANAYDGAPWEEKALARLAKIAEKGYDNYVKAVLPLELDRDPALAEEHSLADGSMNNTAWLRWQKRVFSGVAKVPVEELNWDGKPVPRFEGLPYKWPEFHKSKETALLMKSIFHVARTYMKQFGREAAERFKEFQPFLWAEVYGPGEFQHMRTHTGAAVAGLYCAKAADADDGRGPEIAFMDPRGEFPPFGHSHTYRLKTDDLLMWPAWAPHSLEVHPSDSRSVYIRFMLWPPGGTTEFDWEDDPTGDMSVKKSNVIRVKNKPSSGDRSEL